MIDNVFIFEIQTVTTTDKEALRFFKQQILPFQLSTQKSLLKVYYNFYIAGFGLYTMMATIKTFRYIYFGISCKYIVSTIIYYSKTTVKIEGKKLYIFYLLFYFQKFKSLWCLRNELNTLSVFPLMFC